MQLPTHYMITHQTDDPAGFLNTLKHSLDAGTRLLQLPARGMEAAVYRALAAKAIASALSIPLNALGGVDAKDQTDAIQAGGQGIAASRGYWKADNE